MPAVPLRLEEGPEAVAQLGGRAHRVDCRGGRCAPRARLLVEPAGVEASRIGRLDEYQLARASRR
jgi:hypothetical protein